MMAYPIIKRLLIHMFHVMSLRKLFFGPCPGARLRARRRLQAEPVARDPLGFLQGARRHASSKDRSLRYKSMES